MRLSKPSFQIAVPILSERHEITDAKEIIDEKNGNDLFGVSEILTLPHSFGYFFIH
jgi:hypothetical protein